MELLTAAQMRAIEQAAIASGAVTGLELMERAGRGVVEAILAEWPELEGGRRGALPPGAADAALPPEYFGKDEGAGRPLRAVVLCGPGNNGGDGFVVARLLKERGWEVEVFLYGDPARMAPDARVNHDRWEGMGEVRALVRGAAATARPLSMHETGVLIDAVFGTGLTRPLEAALEDSIAFFHSQWGLGEVRTVAVDMPSGLDSDSGRYLLDRGRRWPSFGTDLCVTFHRPKRGHYIGDALIGKLVIKPIGLDEIVLRQERIDVSRIIGSLADALRAPPEEFRRGLTPESASGVAPAVAEATVWLLGGVSMTDDLAKPTGHKYTHGHALILSGPPGRGGAARLAARGALRIGAGVVTVGCPPDAIPENAARLDAIMLRPVADAGALSAMLGDLRISALCLGPGMGTGEREADLLAAALGVPFPGVPGLTRDPDSQGATRPDRGPGSSPGQAPGSGRGRPSDNRSPVVLDADALTILSRRTDLFAALHEGCVLTPHAGEFARLFPDIAAKLAEPATRGPAWSKVDATRDAAARAGCVVLFKGPDTVIAHPDGRCTVNAAHHDRAAPWLATAGSGDVLAGFITGLLARGIDPMRAAETAAWLHVECARSFGPGLIAEDLPEELPKVFRALGL